jgi:hypothetical protein
MVVYTIFDIFFSKNARVICHEKSPMLLAIVGCEFDSFQRRFNCKYPFAVSSNILSLNSHYTYNLYLK